MTPKDFNLAIIEICAKYGYHCIKSSITMDTLWGVEYGVTIFDCNTESRKPLFVVDGPSPVECMHKLESELIDQEFIKTLKV